MRIKLLKPWSAFAKGQSIEVSETVGKQLIDDKFATEVTRKNKVTRPAAVKG